MAQKAYNYYLSNLRTGVAAKVTEEDTLPGSRLTIPVTVNIGMKDKKGKTIEFEEEGVKKNSKDIEQQVALYGPGDVLGFDEKIIAKKMPVANNGNFRADLIPFIEFNEPDFLWRFSTLKASNGKDWIPWLSLIILKQKDGAEAGEFEFLSNVRDPKLPARISLLGDNVLPDLSAAWRWAHIHLTDRQEISKEEIQQKVLNKNKKTVSRLLAPRRLKPNTRYTAFVVPTYLLGIKAAFGESIDAQNDSRTALAWQGTSVPKGTEIPYYHKWAFRTGTRGDFEYLIKQLSYRKLPGLGLRKIDCSQPGYQLSDEVRNDTPATTKDSAGIMYMEGALRSPDTAYQKWGMDAGTFNETQKKLAELLNKREFLDSNGKTQLRVVPPVYGAWYTDFTEVNSELKTGGKYDNNWLNELNLDFRHRIAAGLGVEYIKENQEQLIKAAWQQLREIQKYNRILNLGRFGREIGHCMYKRIKKLPPEKMLQLGMPLQSKVRDATITNNAVSRNSRSAKTPKPTIQKQLKDSSFSDNLGRLKMRKYMVKKYDTIQSGVTNSKFVNNKRVHFEGVENEEIVPEIFTINGIKGKKSNRPIVQSIKRSINKSNRLIQNLGSRLTAKINPTHTIEKPLCARIQKVRAQQLSKETPPYNPNTNARSLNSSTPKEDVLRDVMWYPEFHSPMYTYLRDKAQDLLLPGLDSVPQNTVSLLTTNQRFVEAFMMGLNHEFASELRWREYPTDMKGSYFRKFWDTTIHSVDDFEKGAFRKTSIGINLLSTIKTKYPNYNTFPKIEKVLTKKSDVTATVKEIIRLYEETIEKWLLTREEDKDIRHLHYWDTWSEYSRLGQHASRNKRTGHPSNAEGQDQLVLLIRGDILQKAPGMLLYLANKNPNEEAVKKGAPLYINKQFPIFEGEFPPDIIFVGFNLSIGEAKTTDYYLIFEERLGNIQYGLDELNADQKPVTSDKWSDVSWQHFPGLAEEAYLDNIPPINKATMLQDGGNWDSSAFIGQVFTQKSVRVGIPLKLFIKTEEDNNTIN